jgi:hypothetical protein
VRLSTGRWHESNKHDHHRHAEKKPCCSLVAVFDRAVLVGGEGQIRKSDSDLVTPVAAITFRRMA